MKIAQICPYDIDRPGGVQRHIRDTARALAALGHRIVIIAPGNGGAAREALGDGVEIARIGRARKIRFGETGYEISIALGAERARLRALMQDDLDVAHFHTVWTPFVAPQALAFYHGPAVATFHDTVADTVSGRMLRGVFRTISRQLLPRFAAVITPSLGPQDSHPAPQRPILVMPPCTDLSEFQKPVPPAMPGTDTMRTILFLGRLEPRKGAMILLAAFRTLKAEGLNLRLIVAGGGSEAGVLAGYVARHAIADVHFVGAPVRTPEWFASADIFCAPSPHGESFGITVVEAMASGKPVIAAANAGYTTLLTGEAAQFLVTPGDSDALAAALRRLAADPALRAKLGAWGRAEAPRHDCAVWAPRLAELYRRAAS
jgi:phosphatidylinositol alpha-mannosyltransferase